MCCKSLSNFFSNNFILDNLYNDKTIIYDKLKMKVFFQMKDTEFWKQIFMQNREIQNTGNGVCRL